LRGVEACRAFPDVDEDFLNRVLGVRPCPGHPSSNRPDQAAELVNALAYSIRITARYPSEN
jgi:hypothetical protein